MMSSANDPEVSNTSDSASSTSHSDSYTNDNGFNIINDSLRSILIHPIGLLLTSLLNEVSLSKTLYKCWDGFRAVEELLTYNSTTICTVRDGILFSAITQWDNESEFDLTKRKSKVNLTSIIFTKIQNQIAKGKLDGYGTHQETSLTMEREEEIGVGDHTGKVDFIVSKRQGDPQQSKKQAVMILEFGTYHNVWWKMFGQIFEYVKILRATKDSKYIIDQPVLMAVVTVRRDTSSDDAVVARMGMFLYIPKEDDSYRLALLWRVDTENIDDASKQFGKILGAARCFSNLIGHLSSTISTDYQYLGPNCCRIGQSVSTDSCFSFAACT